MSSQTDRERRHQGNLERINNVQVVVGRGDRARIDHEGTLLERARLTIEELRAHEATERGLAALDRLLRTLEEGRSRHAHDVAAFVAALRENKPLPLTLLRGADQPVGDDMLEVLDAYRHARIELLEHVRGGPRRVGKVLAGTLATG
jgi:hypothetical protein